MREGQLPTEQILRVIREDSLQGDSVIYTFSRGFSIIVTVNGISFGGSSTVFNSGQLHQIKKYLRYAEKLYHTMAMGEGIIPEAELHGELKLRERFRDGFYTAWYQGHRPEYEYISRDRLAAIRSVRRKWIQMHGVKAK